MLIQAWAWVRVQRVIRLREGDRRGGFPRGIRRQIGESVSLCQEEDGEGEDDTSRHGGIRLVMPYKGGSS